MNFTKFYLFLGLFFAAFFSSIAQSGFNYQSLIKDANGAVLTNTQISLKFSILYDSSSGTPVYVETHGLTTPANGVVNLVIGSGTATTGSFSNIDWSKASIYLKREVDIANSGTYTDFGTALLYNVPKANYSSSTQGISYNSSTVSITNLNVTNTITATAFVGDGSGLTGINASVSSSTHLDSNYSIAIGGVVSATNSVAVGFQALSSNTTGGYNTAIGYQSLISNTTGSYNSSNGAYALLNNTTGNYNTAVGYQSLSLTTSGTGNTAIGYQSLFSNTSGMYNTALGWQSLILNTSGNWNTAIGNTALYSNSSGTRNSAIGNESLRLNTIGINNSANGFNRLGANTSGSYNTAHGYTAGFTNTSGSYNTLIGSNANVGSNNLTNATAIGANAIVTASNTIQLGDLNVGYVKHYGTLSASSDRRLKENIVKTPYGLAEVLKLNPVNYRFISNGLNQIGFIAQEVQPLLPEVVTGTEGDIEKGETLGITYSSLIPVLTKAIQEQQQQLEAQQKQIQSLIKRLEAIENK